MKILLIQEIITFYRTDFFKQLEQLLNQDKIYFAYGQAKCKTGRVGEKDPSLKNTIKITNYSFKLFGFSIVFQGGILKSIFQVKPDIVIFSAHSGNISNWINLLMSKILGFKTIAWVCGWDDKDSGFKNKLYKIFINNVDFCLAYHTTAYNYLKKFGVEENRIKILFNTINEQKILDKLSYYRYKALELKNEFSLCSKVLLYVGATLKEKNLEVLIEAALHLEDYTVIIVGDGENRLSLIDYSKNLNTKNVIFTGEIIRDVDAYFEMCDIFILPGTGGLAINQALIHSKPVICGKADGSEVDLVIDGWNGYRIKDIDSKKIIEAVRSIEKKGKEKMGYNSFSIIRDKIKFNNFIENYIYGINVIKGKMNKFDS